MAMTGFRAMVGNGLRLLGWALIVVKSLEGVGAAYGLMSDPSIVAFLPLVVGEVLAYALAGTCLIWLGRMVRGKMPQPTA